MALVSVSTPLLNPEIIILSTTLSSQQKFSRSNMHLYLNYQPPFPLTSTRFWKRCQEFQIRNTVMRGKLQYNTWLQVTICNTVALRYSHTSEFSRLKNHHALTNCHLANNKMLPHRLSIRSKGKYKLNRWELQRLQFDSYVVLFQQKVAGMSIYRNNLLRTCGQRNLIYRRPNGLMQSKWLETFYQLKFVLTVRSELAPRLYIYFIQCPITTFK